MITKFPQKAKPLSSMTEFSGCNGNKCEKHFYPKALFTHMAPWGLGHHGQHQLSSTLPGGYSAWCCPPKHRANPITQLWAWRIFPSIFPGHRERLSTHTAATLEKEDMQAYLEGLEESPFLSVRAKKCLSSFRMEESVFRSEADKTTKEKLAQNFHKSFKVKIIVYLQKSTDNVKSEAKYFHYLGWMSWNFPPTLTKQKICFLVSFFSPLEIWRGAGFLYFQALGTNSIPARTELNMDEDWATRFCFFFSFSCPSQSRGNGPRETTVCHQSLESPIFSLLSPNIGEIAKPEKCEKRRQKNTDWHQCFQNKSGAPCLFQSIQEFKEWFRPHFSKQVGSFIFLLPRLLTPNKKNLEKFHAKCRVFPGIEYTSYLDVDSGPSTSGIRWPTAPVLWSPERTWGKELRLCLPKVERRRGGERLRSDKGNEADFRPSPRGVVSFGDAVILPDGEKASLDGRKTGSASGIPDLELALGFACLGSRV